MIVVEDDAVPVNVWDEYQRWDEVDPPSGLGVTDQVEPASTDTAVPVVVSVNDFAAPF